MAGEGGLEPATIGFGIRRSTIGAIRLNKPTSRKILLVSQIIISSLYEQYAHDKIYKIYVLKIFQYEFSCF